MYAQMNKRKTGGSSPPYAGWRTVFMILALPSSPQSARAEENRLPAAMLERPYQLTVAVRGGEGDISWTVVGDLPPGLTFADGRVAGTPERIGTWSFMITVTDAMGDQSGPFAYVLEVVPEPAPHLTIISERLPVGSRKTPYVFDLAAGGGMPPYRWSIADGALPPWAELLDQTVSGTPDHLGTYSLTIRVTDSAGQSADSEPLALEILENPLHLPLRFVTRRPPNASYRIPYETLLEAEGGFPPYTWSVTGLPAWLKIRGNRLVGTPPRLGDHSIDVSLRDSEGSEDAARIDLRVVPPPLNESFEILTESVPLALIDRDYVAWIVATGALPPYRFEKTGDLPRGLTWRKNGSIRGTPARIGEWDLSISAVDALGRPAESDRQVTLRVVAATEPPPNPVWPWMLAIDYLSVGAMASLCTFWMMRRRFVALSWPIGSYRKSRDTNRP